jgi:hypothetical protein
MRIGMNGERQDIKGPHLLFHSPCFAEPHGLWLEIC